MTRFTTTIDFIHICNEQKSSRFDSLVKAAGLGAAKLTPFREDIEYILNFISCIDKKCHQYGDDYEAFNQTFHLSISSDLRSLIILAATHQNFQMNIILRHFIEVFIVSLWIDIGSQFTGGFDYFLESRKWKQHIKHYRIFWDNGKNPVRSIKQRLVRIKMLNSSRGHGTRFYKNYLSDASETDLRLLLSLPICNECKVKQKKDDFKGAYSRYYITTNVTKKGKEDKKAKYKTDFHFTCNFCYKQKPTKSYAMGVPDISDMIDMLKQILADRFIINLGFIQKIYSYLSDEFVHFATSITPDQKPSLQEFGSGNAKAVLWGLKGVIFCLDILKPLIEDYFEAKTKIY